MTTYTRVIEEPTIYDDPVQRGTFVVIAVDALASVRLLDDQARRDAALIQSTKCLAVVEGHANFDWSDAEGAFRLSLMFLLAGPALPEHPTPWAAVPIAPTPPHPEAGGRRALKTTPPLHSSPCYVHTTSSISGVVSRVHQHAGVGPTLPQDAFRALSTAVIEDGMRACDEENERVAERMFRGMGDEDDEDEDEDFDMDMGMDMEEDDAGDIEDLIGRDDVPRMRLSFEMWTDAAALKELGDPADVYAAIDQLRRIEKDWAIRQASRTPETMAWLDDVAHAEPPAPEDVPPSEPGTDMDTLVNPEDAVDYKIEKERLRNFLLRPLGPDVHRVEKRKKDTLRIDWASPDRKTHRRIRSASVASDVTDPAPARPGFHRMSVSQDLSHSVPCSQDYLSTSPSKFRALLAASMV
ncbi:hypothetical protein AURDEDRAFT_114947 [Auricularia subglabra TFB-10046 SS5]|nr:hypothetical protein AURDEDRAFT_114947 [Auricularia subglabra TFB-10046 SS5]